MSTVAHREKNSFPIRISSHGHIYVTVAVSDAISADFILDTGAGIHCLSKQLFDKVHVDSIGRYSALRATGDRLDLDLYQLSSLSIGHFRVESPIVTCWEILDSVQIEGILSAKFFEHLIVALDLQENRLVFEDHLTLPSRLRDGYMIPLKLKQDRDKVLGLFVDIQYGDQRVVECTLDTGGATRFDVGLMPLLPVKNTNSWERTNETGMKETITAGNIPFIALACEPAVRQEDPYVSFLPMIYDGQIGSSFLKDRVVTFNIRDKYMVVQRT